MRRESRKADSTRFDMLPRKTSRVKLIEPVPQTDSGGWVENTKVYERSLVKELGKTAAVTSG